MGLDIAFQLAETEYAKNRTIGKSKELKMGIGILKNVVKQQKVNDRFYNFFDNLYFFGQGIETIKSSTRQNVHPVK